MRSNSAVFFCALAAVLLLLLLGGGPAAVESATCSLSALTPCGPAVLGSSPPTSKCCSVLEAQASCLCQYKNDPSLSIYFTAGQKVAAACGVAVPSCD